MKLVIERCEIPVIMGIHVIYEWKFLSINEKFGGSVITPYPGNEVFNFDYPVIQYPDKISCTNY